MTTPFVGEIRLFGFSRVPNNWLPCDGSLQPISQYDALFSLIGTTYGGDGQTTFAVPDLRGQLPLHNGTGKGLTPRVIGESGGVENVTLLTGQLPAHTHTMTATTVAATSMTPGSELGAITGDTMYITDLTGATAAAMAPASIGASGNTQPHDNLMPTLTVQYCVAWAGIYPSQN